MIAGLKSAVSTAVCKAKNIKAATAIEQSMPVILVTVDEKQLDCQIFDDLRMMIVEIRIMTLKEEDDQKARLLEVVEAVDAYYRTAQSFRTLAGYTQIRAAQMLHGGIMDEDTDPDWHQAAGHFLVPFMKTEEIEASASASA